MTEKGMQAVEILSGCFFLIDCMYAESQQTIKDSAEAANLTHH